jgi:hypothetical protein
VDSLVFSALDTAQEKLLSMSWVDMLIVAIYFAVVILIGVYLKKYAATGED